MISLAKTKWVLGSHIPEGWDPGELQYEGHVVERVCSFRYLGLEFTGSPSYRVM